MLGSQVRTCAVTGSSGYLGSRIAAHLETAGFRVLRLSRSSRRYPFQLGVPLSPEFFRREGVTHVVHCAHDFTLRSRREETLVNIGGSRLLFRESEAGGVRRSVFISSMAAFEGCRSRYGQTKLAIEREALGRAFAVVRPGLVYGTRPGGVIGAMERAAARLPVLPLIGRGTQRLHLVHEDDLCAIVGFLLASPAAPPGEAVTAAHPAPHTLRGILASLARRRGRKARFVVTPWWLSWMVLVAIERLGARPPLRSDSVVSLTHLDPSPVFRLAAFCPAVLRDFGSAE